MIYENIFSPEVFRDAENVLNSSLTPRALPHIVVREGLVRATPACGLSCYTWN